MKIKYTLVVCPDQAPCEYRQLIKFDNQNVQMLSLPVPLVSLVSWRGGGQRNFRNPSHHCNVAYHQVPYGNVEISVELKHTEFFQYVHAY